MATRKESAEGLVNSELLPAETESIYVSICHAYPEDKELKHRDSKKLIVVSIVCLLFMIAEIVGGILSNSLAIASDAAHLLTDLGAFMVSLASIWISSKSRTPDMSFGFHRAEILGALVSILSIWLITGILLYIAVQRVITPTFELNSVVMIYVSVAGIIANLSMGVILVTYKGGVSTANYGNLSISIRSAVIHVVGDLLQSIGVLIASLVLHYKPEWKIIDPICTFMFSFIILTTTIGVMKDIIRVLMEGSPKHLNFFEVKNVLFSIPGVLRIHNMRMWSLTMDKVALCAHIVIEKGKNQSDVLKNACQIIGNNLNIFEVTLQVEETGDEVNDCSSA